MESKIVIMIKFGSKDDNFICEDINDTLTACGGDVTFWKLKKFWYSTDNQSTVVITIYRECYDIKKKGKDFVFYYHFFLISTSSFVLNFVCFREIIAGFGIDESYNYIQHVV